MSLRPVTTRIVFAGIGLFHAALFLGVFLEGLHAIRTRIILSDAFYGSGIGLVGGVLLLITLNWTLDMGRVRPEDAIKRVRKNGQKWLIAILVTLILALVPTSRSSMLLFLGHAAGLFLSAASTAAYSRSTGVDASALRPLVAWLFQFYFVSYLVGLLISLKARFRHARPEETRSTDYGARN